MEQHGHWTNGEPQRRSFGIARRVYAQGIVTLVVLLTGIGFSVSNGSSGGAAAATPASVPSSTPAVVTPTPTYTPDPNYTPPPPGPPAIAPPRHHTAVHLKNVSWSRLLPKTPGGWSVATPAQPLSAAALSQEYAVPSSARRDLSFDGYQRGVKEQVRGPRAGDVEEIWQFNAVSGAAAWTHSVAVSNQAGANPDIKRSYVFGVHKYGYVGNKLDGSGYHFGVGFEQVGSLVVHVRLFGTSPITEAQVRSELRRVAGRVEAAGPVQVGHGGGTSSSTESTTNT